VNRAKVLMGRLNRIRVPPLIQEGRRFNLQQLNTDERYWLEFYLKDYTEGVATTDDANAEASRLLGKIIIEGKRVGGES